MIVLPCVSFVQTKRNDHVIRIVCFALEAAMEIDCIGGFGCCKFALKSPIDPTTALSLIRLVLKLITLGIISTVAIAVMAFSILISLKVTGHFEADYWVVFLPILIVSLKIIL
jgi:hypothetical protein